MTDEENHNFVPDDLSNYKVAREGSLVINKMKAWQGSLGIAPLDGIVSPAYFVFDLKIADKRFGQALLRSRPYVSFFGRASDGVRIGQWDLSVHQMKRIPVAVPPLPEQTAIVRFVDHADRRIQRYIRAKKKLIALLNEQKQAIIHHAVTRGLDPNVRLKPSGLEWLGDVPEHWQVCSLRRYWSVVDCKHLTVPFTENGIPLASVREAQHFDLTLGDARRTSAEWYELLIGGGRAPQQGDLIYCRNVSVGAAAFVGTDEQFAMGQDVCLIRSKEQNQRYLNYFFRSPAMAQQLMSVLVGSTFNRINVEQVKALDIVVPSRREQDVIADHLDNDLAWFEKGIEKALLQIQLVREYRTRLIADVVTGKLDVRAAAASLPDDELAAEPFDELDALAEIDEEPEEVDLEAEALPA